jgi:hypothetical protein
MLPLTTALVPTTGSLEHVKGMQLDCGQVGRRCQRPFGPLDRIARPNAKRNPAVNPRSSDFLVDADRCHSVALKALILQAHVGLLPSVPLRGLILKAYTGLWQRHAARCMLLVKDTSVGCQSCPRPAISPRYLPPTLDRGLRSLTRRHYCSTARDRRNARRNSAGCGAERVRARKEGRKL